MGRPVFFRQQRPGLHGEPFTMHKLRTMREPRRNEVFFRTDANRLTPLGRFLRQTSIDELPELWDVLRGKMSLVGPRPLLMEYLPRYTPEQKRRHEVRPGITGWAQIHGRQHVKFGKRLELDVWYVDNASLLLDLYILARTAREVFRASNIVHGQTVEEVDDIGLAPPAPSGARAGKNGVHAP
jgi:lipopolysaccharide/colanic/teichoic acid biosynthesis glycosyltransferase